MSGYLSEELVGAYCAYVGARVGLMYINEYCERYRERRHAMGKVQRPRADPERIRELEAEVQLDWDRRITAVVGSTERTVVWDQSQFNKIPEIEPEPEAQAEPPAPEREAAGDFRRPRSPEREGVSAMRLREMTDSERHNFLFGLSSEEVHAALRGVHKEYEASGDRAWRNLAGEIGHYYSIAVEDENRRKRW